MSKIRLLVVMSFVVGLLFGATALAEEPPKGDAPAAEEKKPQAKPADKAADKAKKAEKAPEATPAPEEKK